MVRAGWHGLTGGRTFPSSGTVLLITGSSRGIGRALAELAAERGACVMINGSTEASVQQACSSLERKGLNVAGCVADVTSPDDGRRLVEQTLGQFGRLDILINNAGLSMRGPLADSEPQAVERVISTNLLGAIYPTQAALRLAKGSLSDVVFVSSLAAVRGAPSVASYCASKMALTAIAESLHGELRESNVHVAICYVGLTENEPEKRILSTAGDLVPIESGFKPQRTRLQTAEWILRCVRRRRLKTVQTLPGKLLWLMNIVAPRFLDLIFRRISVRSR